MKSTVSSLGTASGIFEVFYVDTRVLGVFSSRFVALLSSLLVLLLIDTSFRVRSIMAAEGTSADVKIETVSEEKDPEVKKPEDGEEKPADGKKNNRITKVCLG